MKARLASLALLSALVLTACNHAGGQVSHIALDQTPEAVKVGFAREFPGLMIAHTDQIALPDGARRYELKFRDAENKYHRKLFTAEGVLVDDKANMALHAARK